MKLCECGNPAAPRKAQCARCEFLDGPIDATRAFVEPLIISTLRLHGTLPMAEIRDELKTAEETVQRALYRMMRGKRVGRYLDVYVPPARQVRVYGRKRNAYSRAQIDVAKRWMYYLTSEAT